MDFEEEIVIFVLLHEKLNTIKGSEFWIHSLLKTSLERGIF
jgi:hypothetical protein